MIASIHHTEDIEGGDYLQLIEWCFAHSTCFSLTDYRFKDENGMVGLLTEHKILKQETVYYEGYNACFKESMGNQLGKVPTLYLYSCNADTKKIFLEQPANTLFGWRYLSLQDPCFYRNDRTQLLYTVSHEGICSISCTSEEFDRLSIKDLWHIEDETRIDDEWYF